MNVDVNQGSGQKGLETQAGVLVPEGQSVATTENKKVGHTPHQQDQIDAEDPDILNYSIQQSAQVSNNFENAQIDMKNPQIAPSQAGAQQAQAPGSTKNPFFEGGDVGFNVAMEAAQLALEQLDKEMTQVQFTTEILGMNAEVETAELSAQQTIKAGEADANALRAQAGAAMVGAIMQGVGAGINLKFAASGGNAIEKQLRSQIAQGITGSISGAADAVGKNIAANETVEGAYARAQGQILQAYQEIYKNLVDAMKNTSLSDSIKALANALEEARSAHMRYMQSISQFH